jgi:tRNA A-37 threonylcarbamoyl transferase component Bud32
MNQGELADPDVTVVTFEKKEGELNTAQKNDSNTDALVGTVFAQKYEIIKLLGKGGMSAVYLARHIVMNKTHALKVLHTHLTKDMSSLRRFTQEAQASSNLNHPNIVAVHDCGAGDDMPYLAMDYIEGQSLAEVLKAEGPMPAPRFIHIMLQVAAGLPHAHSVGIVHRDLKPSNIMLSKGKEQVKIVDFGIAKILSDSTEGTNNLTQTGEIFGSPHYMSPEQCSGTQVDRRSDIYSLGCVMYELLSGKTPHQGNTVIETIYKHINTTPPPLVAPQLDEATKNRVELILLRCMAKLPNERFQSMSEVERELRSLGLQSKAGIFRALGGAWDLAAAKRRAANQSQKSLIGLALLSSAISLGAIFWAMNQADVAMAKLEQSETIVRTFADAQAAFLKMAEATREYGTALLLNPSEIKESNERFMLQSENFDKTVDTVSELLKADPDWKEKSHQISVEWKKLSLRARTTTKMMQPVDSNYAFSPQTGMAILQLSHICQNGEHFMRQVAKRASTLHEATLAKFRQAQNNMRLVSIGCGALNGAIILGFAFYFMRSAPRLKKLAESAARLSQNRGIPSSNLTQDEVENLDNVLQDLASALSEAEEREKLLLQKINEQKPVENEQPESVG